MLKRAKVSSTIPLEVLTAGVNIEPRLSRSHGCEASVVRLRRLEIIEKAARIRLLQSEERKLRLERERIQMRLEGNPPDLSPDPGIPELRVRLVR